MASSPAGEVVFDRVHFAYDGDKYVLLDVSFTTKARQTLAIIGATGSGKSTLVNLIPRLYDPTRGRILIDGVDLREIDLLELRSRIGVVLQESRLFTGTIRENLCLGRPDADLAEVEAAARAAQAHEFIAQLPDGYETRVGQRGVNLSGGQRQRIAIARALLVQPAILILDDSLSAVDFETERKLRQALAELRSRCTITLIAQRITSAMSADQILVLDEGRLVDHGTHAELLSRCRVYQEICRSQLGDEVAVGG